MESPTHASPKSDLSVVEVRRNLAEMRKQWRSSRPDAPFHTSACVGDAAAPLTISQFAFCFVQGHHRQRRALAK